MSLALETLLRKLANNVYLLTVHASCLSNISLTSSNNLSNHRITSSNTSTWLLSLLDVESSRSNILNLNFTLFLNHIFFKNHYFNTYFLLKYHFNGIQTGTTYHVLYFPIIWVEKDENKENEFFCNLYGALYSKMEFLHISKSV